MKSDKKSVEMEWFRVVRITEVGEIDRTHTISY